jgi:repressor of nif and glnA expression
MELVVYCPVWKIGSKMSMKTRIDKVLMKHGVDQTAQFGGILKGMDVTSLQKQLLSSYH